MMMPGFSPYAARFSARSVFGAANVPERFGDRSGQPSGKTPGSSRPTVPKPTARRNEDLPLSASGAAGRIPQTTRDKAVIRQALSRLAEIQPSPADAALVFSLGVNPIFRNGREALQVLRNRNISVEFGDMGDSPAHAQWLADANLVMINARYRNDASPNTLYAISEAIYHELGHAARLVRDPYTGVTFNSSLYGRSAQDIGDDQSSIQEELDCLALNSLAHRFNVMRDPRYAGGSSNSRLISDGVALYERLFFDPDVNKTALVSRVVRKYGDLPLFSPGHEIPFQARAGVPLAYRVAWQSAARRQAFSPMPRP